MPFRTLNDNAFLGRQRELTNLYHKVCQADTSPAQSLMLSGARGIGKTELLKQLFGLLFWKQDRIAPFYLTINPALVSAPAFAETYLAGFLRQRFAFDQKDQDLCSREGMSLSALAALADERGAGWARELLDQFRQNSTDPIARLRMALDAPHRSTLRTGMPVAVLIDEFHRLKNLSLEGTLHPELASLFEGPMAGAKTPHVITGSVAELQEMPSACRLDTIELAPLGPANMASKAAMLLHELAIEGSVPPLLLRRLGGNPFYLLCLCNALSGKNKMEDKDFWNAYTGEITQGALVRCWSSALKHSFPDFRDRHAALVVSHAVLHAQEPLTCGRIASSCGLPEDRAEAIAHTLYLAGVIRGAFGLFRPQDDDVVRDVIDNLHAQEVLVKSARDLERDCREKLLPEKADAVHFDLVLPMAKEAELVAAQCLEQVGKNLHLSQDVIGQLQIAVIEACINAMEHGKGTDNKMYVGFAADEQRLEISIESSGPAFIVQETGEPFGGREGIRPPGRGWGIKLMKRFVDDVRFEKTARGAKTVLIKNLNGSLHPNQEATNHD